MNNKSIKIEGDNQAPIITGDNNTVNYTPNKILFLHEVITQWQSQTKISLSPKLALESREKQIKEFLNLLSQSPSKIIIVSSTKEESYAFIINALQTENEYRDRVRVITNQESWDKIVKEEDLILIYRGFIPHNIGVAIAQGHFIVEAEETINIKDKSHYVIELPKIKKRQHVDTLQDMGISFDDAWKVIEDTKGFLHAITQHPLLQPYEKIKPDWVEKYSIDILSTILFVNSWNKTCDEDKIALSQLSGLDYKDFEKELYLLSKETNPPIRLVGNVWQVISKINLFDLISHKILFTQLDKLKSIAIDILTEIDPAYELVPEQRSYATIYDKVMKYSGLIRHSLADTFVMLSVFGDIINTDIHTWINNLLQEIFEKNLSVESWYSYHHILPMLAEASPESFLTSLEKSLEKIEENKIEELFTDNGDLMMGECNYCYLLWALETVSWNQDYFVRVVLLLAQLSELDIEYGRNNRPFNSLKDIFIGWVQYCSVTHKDRMEIIENILLKKYPNIAWKLLLELLPDNHSVSTGISKPKYHTWADVDDTILQKDYIKYCNEVNRLLYENLDDKDNQKWYDVFNNIDKFYKEYFFKIIDKFMSLDKESFSDDIRLKIANILRHKIHNHRSYPDAHWTLPKEYINKLEEAFYFIEPKKLVDKYQYLFEMGSIDILNPIPYNQETFTEDHEKEENIVEELRKKAIKHILTDGSFDDLIQLIKRSSSSWDIGRILFILYSDKYTKIMLSWLEDENSYLVQCAKSYMQNLVRESFDETVLDGLSNIQKSELILAMPFCSRAFELLKKQNITVQKLYWEKINWYYALENNDLHYINWIIEQFYNYELLPKAINFVSHMIFPIKREKVITEIDIELLFKILYEIDPNHEALDRHSISEVVKYLQKSNIKEEHKRFLEWKYLMLKSFEPTYWERLIIQNPKSFVELVSWIYKPEKERNEDKDLTQDQIKNRANNAKELLERIRLFREYDDIKSMNKDQLTQWIYQAKEAFKAVDRVNIGNRQIGILLAKSSKKENEIFPNKMVCEIIEEYQNNEFEEGFIHEILYPGGHRFTTKVADEGGEQEYALAEKYKKYADKLKLIYPRTANLLIKISDWYLEEAKREDMKNEI
jgi:hypothetical protein